MNDDIMLTVVGMDTGDEEIDSIKDLMALAADLEQKGRDFNVFYGEAAIALGGYVDTGFFATDAEPGFEFEGDSIRRFVRFVQVDFVRNHAKAIFAAGRHFGREEIKQAMAEASAATKN